MHSSFLFSSSTLFSFVFSSFPPIQPLCVSVSAANPQRSAGFTVAGVALRARERLDHVSQPPIKFFFDSLFFLLPLHLHQVWIGPSPGALTSLGSALETTTTATRTTTTRTENEEKTTINHYPCCVENYRGGRSARVFPRKVPI